MIIQIISLLCIILFRVWLLRQLQHKLWPSIFWRCSAYTVISVLCIAWLARLRNDSQITSLITSVIASFIPSVSHSFYLSLLAIIFIGVALRKKSRLSSLVQSVLVIGIWSLIPSLSQSLANVRSEESLKQASFQWWWQQSIFSDNTTLFLLACVSAIVFGGIENIFFFMKARNSGDIVMLDYIIQRSLIPLLIHIASVGITIAIGYMLYRYYKSHDTNTHNTSPQTLWLRKKISLFLEYSLALILASTGWIAFHSLYNLALGYQLWIMIPILFIASIAIISYGLFRSDLLYTSTTT